MFTINSVYIGILLVIVVSCGYIFYIYRMFGEKAAAKEAKEIAYKLMLYAEKNLGSGEEKFAWVVNRFYEIIPDSVRKLLKEEDVEEFLQNSYDELKNILHDGNK